MAETLHVQATLQPRGPAAAVVLTDEQVGSLGGGKTPPVKVTVNGHTFDGRIGRRGGEYLLGFNAAVRAATGVAAGDTIDVEIVLDDSDRAVEVPSDLAEALTAAGLSDGFAALAPSHRKEYVRWITEAKKPETRERRAGKAVVALREG